MSQVSNVTQVAAPSTSAYDMDEVWLFSVVLTPSEVVHVIQYNSMVPPRW